MDRTEPAGPGNTEELDQEESGTTAQDPTWLSDFRQGLQRLEEVAIELGKIRTIFVHASNAAAISIGKNVVVEKKPFRQVLLEYFDNSYTRVIGIKELVRTFPGHSPNEIYSSCAILVRTGRLGRAGQGKYKSLKLRSAPVDAKAVRPPLAPEAATIPVPEKSREHDFTKLSAVNCILYAVREKAYNNLELQERVRMLRPETEINTITITLYHLGSKGARWIEQDGSFKWILTPVGKVIAAKIPLNLPLIQGN